MDFNFNDDQAAIRELSHRIFTDRATDEFLLEFSRSGDCYDDALWATLAEQGLLGIAVPEDQGGSGLGLVELCLMLEEQGRRVAPVPLLSSLVLGGLPLAAFGTEAQKRQWLPALVSGQARLSAAIAEANMNPALRVPVEARREGDGYRLTGTRQMVPDAAVSSAIIVPAVVENDGKHEKTTFLVDTSLPGVAVEAGAPGPVRRARRPSAARQRSPARRRPAGQAGVRAGRLSPGSRNTPMWPNAPCKWASPRRP